MKDKGDKEVSDIALSIRKKFEHRECRKARAGERNSNLESNVSKKEDKLEQKHGSSEKRKQKKNRTR